MSDRHGRNRKAAILEAELHSMDGQPDSSAKRYLETYDRLGEYAMLQRMQHSYRGKYEDRGKVFEDGSTVRYVPELHAYRFTGSVLSASDPMFLRPALVREPFNIEPAHRHRDTMVDAPCKEDMIYRVLRKIAGPDGERDDTGGHWLNVTLAQLIAPSLARCNKDAYRRYSSAADLQKVVNEATDSIAAEVMEKIPEEEMQALTLAWRQIQADPERQS